MWFNIFTKNGGAVSDLKTHWKYIQLLKKDINNLFLYELGVDFKLLNYPLHHLIISQIPFVNSNLKISSRNNILITDETKKIGIESDLKLKNTMMKCDKKISKNVQRKKRKLLFVLIFLFKIIY